MASALADARCCCRGPSAGGRRPLRAQAPRALRWPRTVHWWCAAASAAGAVVRGADGTFAPLPAGGAGEPPAAGEVASTRRPAELGVGGLGDPGPAPSGWLTVGMVVAAGSLMGVLQSQARAPPAARGRGVGAPPADGGAAAAPEKIG
ncbi:unnamed protein product [Prorocentrum cordatum]|uniref:Uncharacterized protein n=1 Tax=Prorocentrum cordatum TaxID=2364126 RepID=A0ABN9SKR9_9DINO|nr:unnamed protein product [Polarella glacialis]